MSRGEQIIIFQHKALNLPNQQRNTILYLYIILFIYQMKRLDETNSMIYMQKYEFQQGLQIGTIFRKCSIKTNFHPHFDTKILYFLAEIEQ